MQTVAQGGIESVESRTRPSSFVVLHGSTFVFMFRRVASVLVRNRSFVWVTMKGE